MELDTLSTWRKQIERRLNEIGSAIKGTQAFNADRITDLVEQIDELRQELKRVSDRQDKMAAWLKAKEKNGS